MRTAERSPGRAPTGADAAMDRTAATDGTAVPVRALRLPAPRDWVVVASRDHVRAAVAGGILQANHGRADALRAEARA